MNIITKLWNRTLEYGATHSTGLLVGFGIAGMITGTVMAVTVTPKAYKQYEEIKSRYLNKETNKIDDKKGYVKEVGTKVVTKYIPAMVVEGLSVYGIVKGTSSALKQSTAYAALYGITKDQLIDYQAKTLETVGERKEQEIRDAIAKDKLEKDPVSNKEVYITADNEQLCYDMVSGRYFMSSVNKLRKIENELNKRLRNEMYISLNELYYEIGLKPIETGNQMGFNIDDGDLEFSFSAQIADDDRPCIVVGFNVFPRYRKFGDLGGCYDR